MDSVLNRSVISDGTNRKKTDRKPSEFYKECLEGHGMDEARLRQTLASHFIGEEAIAAMRADDFSGFLEARQQLIGKAVSQILEVSDATPGS